MGGGLNGTVEGALLAVGLLTGMMTPGFLIVFPYIMRSCKVLVTASTNTIKDLFCTRVSYYITHVDST